MITPYVDGEGGVWVARLPAQGPCRGESDVPCRLSFDHHRHRKTGPEIPLTVLRCLTHQRGFTLYPPGYVPYGRQRVAPVALDGSAVHAEQSAGELEAYAATAFGAAVDAAAGRAWSREGSGPWWSVQGRALARLTRWIGVAVELDEHVRGALAAMLGVAQLVLREQARHIATVRAGAGAVGHGAGSGARADPARPGAGRVRCRRRRQRSLARVRRRLAGRPPGRAGCALTAPRAGSEWRD